MQSWPSYREYEAARKLLCRSCADINVNDVEGGGGETAAVYASHVEGDG